MKKFLRWRIRDWFVLVTAWGLTFRLHSAILECVAIVIDLLSKGA